MTGSQSLLSEPVTWQTAAAVLSAATTVALAVLTARYVRLTKAVSEASRDQVELLARAQRTMQSAIAGALLEEARRLRAALPLPFREFPFGADRPNRDVPSIHPWIHRIIPDVAHADPTVIGVFMRLERRLIEYQYVAELQGQAHVTLLNAQKTLEANVRDSIEPNGNKVSIEERLRGSQEAVDEATANLANWQMKFEAAYAACDGELESLETRLAQALARVPQVGSNRGNR